MYNGLEDTTVKVQITNVFISFIFLMQKDLSQFNTTVNTFSK